MSEGGSLTGASTAGELIPAVEAIVKKLVTSRRR